MYDKHFGENGVKTGQLLITKSDVENDERRQNLINAFNTMLEYGAIPIVNENDSVAVEEIVYGDNDSLSAIVAKLINADALIILSDIDGLYSDDPKKNPNAVFIEQVDELSDELMGMGKATTGSDVGTGGMAAKLYAAKIATHSGCDMVIANAEKVEVVWDIAIEGKTKGTLFTAHKTENFDLLDYIESIH